jgi:hypothetical protein
MNPLKVLTRRCADGFETVFTVGAEQGVLRMPAPQGLRNLPLTDAVELVALHHLMGRLELYGRARLDAGEPVYVSQPALASWVAAGRRLGADYVYVAFLRKRFAAVPLVPAAHDVPVGPQARVRRLPACEPYEDTLAVRGVAGRVTVSEHALERVQTRFNMPTLSHAWLVLQRALRHASVREVTLDDAHAALKETRHGEPGRHFTVDSGLTAVIVDNHLRTVYWRKFGNT